jgi:hypothetical protein
MSEEKQLSVYDEMATRHNAAYAAFSTIYEAKTPRPIEPKTERDSLFVPIALVIMIAASVLVSGSRTVEEFGGGLIGYAAFLMLEGAIVSYAFYRTRRNFNEHRLESVRKLANFGLGLAFTVAVAANVNAILKGENETSTPVKTIIHLLVAVSAPTLAFISGDIMAVETMARESRKRKNREAYEKKLASWSRKLNDAWASEKSRWGVTIKVERPPEQQTEQRRLSEVSVLSASDQTDNGQTARSGYGHNRTPDGQARVIEYLSTNPEHASLPSRELAKLIGVGHDTANKGRNTWRGQQTQ